MNESLQKKIDAIKKGRDPEDFHPLMCFDAHSPKIEYEMPADYQMQTAQLLEIIEKRDFVVKELPNILAEDRQMARVALSETARAIDEMEANLEKRYLEYQREQREEQELYEATYLQNEISEEHFIMVKHLKPHIFEKFKAVVFKYMTEAEIEEQLELIARREAAELDKILAGDRPLPEYYSPHLKRLSPYDMFNWELNTMAMIAYQTDDIFKEKYKIIEEAKNRRFKLAARMGKALPVYRRRLDHDIRLLEPAIRRSSEYLHRYFEENKRNGKFTELENPDQEKLDECFSRLRNYHMDVFIVNKHLNQETFQEFEKVATEFMTAEEKAEFYQNITKQEEKSLDSILRSVANEIH